VSGDEILVDPQAGDAVLMVVEAFAELTLDLTPAERRKATARLGERVADLASWLPEGVR